MLAGIRKIAPVVANKIKVATFNGYCASVRKFYPPFTPRIVVLVITQIFIFNILIVFLPTYLAI